MHKMYVQFFLKGKYLFIILNQSSLSAFHSLLKGRERNLQEPQQSYQDFNREKNLHVQVLLLLHFFSTDHLLFFFLT